VVGQGTYEVWWPTDLVSGYKGPECRKCTEKNSSTPLAARSVELSSPALGQPFRRHEHGPVWPVPVPRQAGASGLPATPPGRFYGGARPGARVNRTCCCPHSARPTTHPQINKGPRVCMWSADGDASPPPFQMRGHDTTKGGFVPGLAGWRRSPARKQGAAGASKVNERAWYDMASSGLSEDMGWLVAGDGGWTGEEWRKQPRTRGGARLVPGV
jgi:hypothetical protein